MKFNFVCVLFAFQSEYDDYSHNYNDMSGKIENMRYFHENSDEMKSRYDRKTVRSSLNQSNDVTNENLSKETEEPDFIAINEMLIDGVQCESVSF